MEQSIILSDEDSDIVGRRDVALTLLRRGTPRDKIIDRTGFTSQELFVIEQNYYEQRETLDERAMQIKQLDRLDGLLDLAYQQMEAFGLANEKGDFGGNLTAILAILREINEVAGLKRTRIETEVRVIREEQINVVVSYVGQVLEAFTNTVAPYLTKTGAKQLEAKKQEWFDAAVEAPAKVLEGSVLI